MRSKPARCSRVSTRTSFAGLPIQSSTAGLRLPGGSTATMIFNVVQLVSYISHFLVLEAGDVITTGTPPGVGMGMKPPTYLKAGDTVALGISSLGQQKQTVVAWEKG